MKSAISTFTAAVAMLAGALFSAQSAQAREA